MRVRVRVRARVRVRVRARVRVRVRVRGSHLEGVTHVDDVHVREEYVTPHLEPGYQ